MNALILAIQTAQNHITSQLSVDTGKEARLEELGKLQKKDLIELIMANERFQEVKIEDLVKPILADPACAWLDYETIANLIKNSVPTAKTSSKSLASYASKNPRTKGWIVQPRKSAAERNAVAFALQQEV